MPSLNAESHFAQSPLGVDIRRSVFDRSFNHKLTFNSGKLNCIMCDEILPGDDVAIRVSDLIRAATPLVPVADDCYVDMYGFFDPCRLEWSHWKEMNGENNSSSWIQTTTYTVPVLNASGSFRAVGDLAHQMGIPPISTAISGKEYIKVNMIPFRGYRRIYNDWFRDQNTQAPKLINTGDTETDTTLFALADVDRIHDYFGSCLPGTQKGNAVKIALSGFAPVVTTPGVANETINGEKLTWTLTSNGSLYQPSGNVVLGAQNSTGYTYATTATTSGSAGSIVPRNLWADMNQQYNDSTLRGVGLDVNVLRLAVQTQKILEKLAIGGSRYTEYIRAMFGVISPDARQQRPELLGHHRHHIRMSDVPQTGPTVSGTTPLGHVGAYSKTADNGFLFKKSFTEHGYLYILMCVRHNRSYSQGIPKMFERKTFGDFYLPALAHIGEQPVYKYQLFADSSVADDAIFGYQEAWAEYRFMPSRNSGYMDPAVSNTLGDIWTYGDVYSAAPTLSDSWMKEGDGAISRTQAVEYLDEAQTIRAPQFIGDFYFDYKHTRCMPVYSVPGLVDHF